MFFTSSDHISNCKAQEGPFLADRVRTASTRPRLEPGCGEIHAENQVDTRTAKVASPDGESSARSESENCKIGQLKEMMAMVLLRAER